MVKVRHLVGMLALMTVLGAGMPAAHAQYPPTVGNGRVTRSEVKQCQCVQFSGDGFLPGTTVTIVDRDSTGMERVVAKATADNKGAFKVKVCFDETARQGEHTLIGRGVSASGPREVHAKVKVAGSVCFAKGDEVHTPTNVGGEDEEQPRGGGNGAPGRPGGGTGVNGPSVGGVGGGLPRTGGEYVIPGLLLGFTLVVTGTGVVHVTRRRRLVTP